MKKRLSVHLLLALALLAPMLVIGQTEAGAVHDGSFQLDGNLAVDGAVTPPYDWESFFNSSGNRSPVLPSADLPGFVDSTFKADYAFPDATTFTSGSKDTLDTSAWSCARSNNLGGKVDIVNAYSTIYADGSDLILYFGIERAATEGDGTMGFWFLKDPSVDCTAGAGGKAPAFGGHHSNGDIFVTAEFSSGGTNAQVQAYDWVGGADGHLDTTAVANGNKCGTAGGSDNACGIVNTTTLRPIWPAPDKNGGDLDVNAFYEGGVRVSGAGGCFATFMANTRSSTSPTATIFDYARGAFPTCQAGTELKLDSYKIGAGASVASGSATPAISVHTGDSLTLTYSEKNTGNFALDKPTAGSYIVIPNSSQSTACVLSEVQTVTAGYNNGDIDKDGKLDGGETWLYSCTVSATASTPTTITAYGHGIDTVSNPGTTKDVTYCTTPLTDNPYLAPATVATCDSDEITAVTLTVLAPSTSMTASVSATIIFSETNDGNASLDSPTDAAFVRLSGTNHCSSFGPVLKAAPSLSNTGDANDNGRLDPLETWQWSCTTSISSTASASSVSTGTGHGIDASNGTDVTFCNAGTTTAYQTATWTPSGTTTAVTTSPKCDPQEQRTVTIGVG